MLHSAIAFMHKIVITTTLADLILITLSTSSFIKPDFMEGRWLVNNITGFIEFFFYKEFSIEKSHCRLT
jgi:magnesium-transporting ATPase (P-type)